MRDSIYEIVITSTWNGHVLPSENHVVLTYDDSNAECLQIEIDAPFYEDEPPGVPAGSTWRLWEHEVVELFLVSPTGAYLELEFGPHGHYLALWLEAPRNIAKKHLKIEYAASIKSGRWLGRARVPKSIVPNEIKRWNAFSISGSPSERQYLAWHLLPGEQPDFHQPGAFRSFPLLVDVD